jgi:hypothetical protein
MIMRLLTIALSVLLVGQCLSETEFGQGLDRWTKIKIFQSKRYEVEKIFGQPRNNPSRNADGNTKLVHLGIYDLPDATVFVTYSGGDCRSQKDALWDVDEWVVTEVEYSPEEGVANLQHLLTDIKPYKRRQAGDVRNHIEHFSDRIGVSIVFDTETKEVLNITVYPSRKMKLTYDCDRMQHSESQNPIRIVNRGRKNN